jgi:hypothetical protein
MGHKIKNKKIKTRHPYRAGIYGIQKDSPYPSCASARRCGRNHPRHRRIAGDYHPLRKHDDILTLVFAHCLR